MTKNTEIVSNNRRIQYDEILCEIANFKQYCIHNGVQRGDSILLKGDNSFELVIAIFSLVSIDTTIIPADNRLSDKELSDLMDEIDIDFVISDTYSNYFSGIYIPLMNGFDKNETPTEELNFDQWMKRSNALKLFTSGSSGKPKIIIKSGELFISNIRETINIMKFKNEVFLPLLPYTHFYGLSVLFIWYLTEGTLTIFKHHHPRNTLNKIISNSTTIVDASPSLYTSLIKYIEHKQISINNQFDRVKMWCVGGAPLIKRLDNKFKKLFRKPLLNGYGLTEIGNVALTNTENSIGCGQLLHPLQAKISNESRESLPNNEIGEISIYVPYEIRDSNHNILNKNGWYCTGDLGYLDEHNNLFVIGRNKPGVKRMGIMIQPHIIELEIQNLCKDMGEVKVITVDDDLKGVSLIFFITNFENEEMFRSTVVGHLSEVSRPDRIIFLKEFPLNRNGKIDLLKLEKMALQYSAKIY